MIIRHTSGSYPVSFEALAGALDHSEGLVITDHNVFDAWKSVLAPRNPIVLPAGEATKSLESYGQLVREIARRRALRHTPLVAVGGGVIGDLVGFAASSYMRGVPFVQIPTTLLAMVDSSVGGKVGIDLPEGKNLVGAFYAPTAVRIPLNSLSTLPERQFRNGMAEVWKYGFIMETSLCERLSRTQLTASSPEVQEVVNRCLMLKAGIVQEDEQDRSGRRAILNFGHTVGHAIEKATGYQSLLHGEAIAIGMVVEARLGELLKFTREGTADKIQQFLANDGLPTAFAGLGHPDILAAMSLDKKAEGNGLAFSLVSDLGKCKLVTGIDPAVVRGLLESL